MDIISQLFSLAESIYDRVKKMKENKEACEYLKKRVEVIIDALEQIHKETPDFEEKNRRGLVSLEETLRSALNLVEECANESSFVMFFKGGSYQDRFEEVNRRLSCNQQDLALGGHVAQASEIREALNNATSSVSNEMKDALAQHGEHQLLAMQALFMKQQEAQIKFQEELKKQVEGSSGGRPPLKSPTAQRNWEIAWDELEFEKDEDGAKIELGEGGFSKVLLGKWRGKEVAVKVFKTNNNVTTQLKRLLLATKFVTRTSSSSMVPQCAPTCTTAATARASSTVS